MICDKRIRSGWFKINRTKCIQKRKKLKADKNRNVDNDVWCMWSKVTMLPSNNNIVVKKAFTQQKIVFPFAFAKEIKSDFCDDNALFALSHKISSLSLFVTFALSNMPLSRTNLPSYCQCIHALFTLNPYAQIERANLPLSRTNFNFNFFFLL